ncbi:MAG: efflux RND transporter permease subunit [Verrucomicrobiota bacterium]
MEAIPRWSTRNRVAVNLMTALVLISGIAVSATQMQRDLFPDVNTNFITVSTIDPETSLPADIERTITIPIEEELTDVKGITKILSTSQDNVSSIFLEVDPDIDDLSEVLNEVRQAADKAEAEMPATAEPPVVEQFDIPFPLITFTLAYPPGTDLQSVRPTLDRIERKIKLVPGVSDVLVDGLEDREVWVEVDPYRLQSIGLGFGEVAESVSRKNRNAVGGRMDGSGGQRVVRVLGEITEPQELEGLVIKREGNRIVRLQDVATVKEAMEEEQTRGRVNIQPAVTYTVVKKKGEDAIRIAAESEHIFRTEAAALPPEFVIQVVSDTTKYINIRILTVMQNGIQALIMVTLLLMFMLNWRLALLVAIGIPVSFAGCFLIMHWEGHSINMLSLFAMIMALGMVVDDAVVVAENVYRYFEEGLSPVQAAIKGTSEVMWPVLGSVSTTVAAFLPLIWGEGIIGKFLAVVPVVVISALVFSLLQAFFVLPSHLSDVVRPARRPADIESEPTRTPGYGAWLLFSAGLAALISVITVFQLPLSANDWILPHVQPPAGEIITQHELMSRVHTAWLAAGFGLFAALTLLFALVGFGFVRRRVLGLVEYVYACMRESVDRGVEVVIQVYIHLLTICLRWRYLVIGGAVAGIFAMGFIVSQTVGFKLFGTDFADTINVKAELPPDYTLEQTEDFIARLEARIAEAVPPEDIVAFVTRVGAKLDATDQFLEYSSNYAMIIVDLDEANPAARAPSIIEEQLRVLLAEFPELVKSAVKKEEGGPPVGRAVNVEIRGPDYAALNDIGEEVLRRLAEVDGVVNVGSDYPRGKTEFQIEIDEDKAARAGVDVAALGQALTGGFRGLEAARLRWGVDEVIIRVKMDERFAQDPEVLRSFRLRNNRGEIVDISSFAQITPQEGYSRIRRLNQERLLTVSGDIDPNKAQIVSSKIVNDKIARWVPELLAEHPNYTISLTGENEDTDKSMNAMALAALVAILLIYALLATITNSLIMPFVIMSVIPFGIIGVFIGLILQNEPLGLMSIMGTIALAGIVVNNSVVFVDFINQHRHRHAHFDDDAEGADVLRQPKQMSSTLRWRSIVGSGRTRFRPIFLTTCTTVVGLYSLAFRSTGQEQFLAPMAQAVVWGLSFATLVTMILIPCLYAIVDDIHFWWWRLTKGEAARRRSAELLQAAPAAAPR